MSDLTATRRPLWLCVWPGEGGKQRLTIHVEQPDAAGALAVLQVRGELASDSPLAIEFILPTN